MRSEQETFLLYVTYHFFAGNVETQAAAGQTSGKIAGAFEVMQRPPESFRRKFLQRTLLGTRPAPKKKEIRAPRTMQLLKSVPAKTCFQSTDHAQLDADPGHPPKRVP